MSTILELAQAYGVPTVVLLVIAFLVVAISFVVRAWISVVNVQRDIAEMRGIYDQRIKNLEKASHGHDGDIDRRVTDFESKVAKEIAILHSNDKLHEQSFGTILERIASVESSVKSMNEQQAKQYDNLVNLIVGQK